MLFVIIARRREVEEEPSARAHLLFPLTLDRDTKSADSKRRKKERDDIRSLALSLSLSERRLCEKRNLWWPLQNPFPPFRKTYPHNVSSFEPQRRCVFFRARERERESKERESTHSFFFSRIFFPLKVFPKKDQTKRKRLLLRCVK